MAVGYTPDLQYKRCCTTSADAAIHWHAGGQLSLFVGWICILVLDECIALSLGELASRYPTSGGPSYWAFQCSPKFKTTAAYITVGYFPLVHSKPIVQALTPSQGWIWLIGNWTITLSVNFGFASLLSATVSMYHPDWTMNSWQLLLVFYAVCLVSFIICTFCNDYLPLVDTICAAWTAVSIVIILIALSVRADVGRHSASYALGNYDTSFSGWGGFTFFIGLLPSAYTFSALGMISSMAEECVSRHLALPLRPVY